jgi:hypothetical protein
MVVHFGVRTGNSITFRIDTIRVSVRPQKIIRWFRIAERLTHICCVRHCVRVELQWRGEVTGRCHGFL